MEDSVLKPSDKDNQLLTPNSLKDSWDAIRVLDEEENWAERNRVLSRSDHEHLVKCAKEIINDLVQNLPISDSNPPWSLSFSTEQLTDDDFKYSEAQFDMDYLERISSEGDSQASALARESLYVKFDPLVGKVSPRKGGKKRTPKRPLEDTSSDLLQFNTPPPVSNRSDAAPNQSYTPSGLLSTSQHSTTNSSASTLTPQSHHHRSQNTSQIHEDEPSTLLLEESMDTAREETDTSNQTGCLVKVLKYSEEDLTRLLEEARRRGREVEKKGLDREVAELQMKIKDMRRQLKPHQNKNHKIGKIEATYKSKRDQVQQEITESSETLESDSKKQKERVIQSIECKSHDKQSKKYYELVSKGASVLEAKFDELHSQHVKLKAVHKTVSQTFQNMEKCQEQLEEQNKTASEHLAHLQAELQSKNNEISQKMERLKKEHASKMSIERTKTMKNQLQVESLETSLQQLIQDKQQLTQLCEELMEQLEAKNA